MRSAKKCNKSIANLYEGNSTCSNYHISSSHSLIFTKKISSQKNSIDKNYQKGNFSFDKTKK